MSHLEEVSSEGVAAMAKSGSVAVVLPTTAYILRLRTDHMRKLLDGDVPVALGKSVWFLIILIGAYLMLLFSGVHAIL